MEFSEKLEVSSLNFGSTTFQFPVFLSKCKAFPANLWLRNQNQGLGKQKKLILGSTKIKMG